MFETHTFALVHTDRYGRKTDRAHQETINANATHLVMVPVDARPTGSPACNRADEGEFPYLMIRAFDATEAAEIAAAHRVTDIWERLPNRSFAPPEVAKRLTSVSQNS